MINQNNGLPQGVITSQKLTGMPAPATNQAPKKKINFSKKGNLKFIIVAVVLVIGAFLLYSLLTGKKISIFNNNKKENEKPVVVDIDSIWGKPYSEEAQKLYSEHEIDKIDVTFANLDFLDYPEMLVRYKNKTDQEVLLVYYIDASTSQVKRSNNFVNGKPEIIYELGADESSWYLYLPNNNKYGGYALFSKIVSGNAKSMDIDVSNEKKKNEFKDRYVVSDYELVFYEVKKANYAENFKTIFGRFEKYDGEIVEKRKELANKYAGKVEKSQLEGPYLKTGSYYLSFGEYNYVPNENSAGKTIDSPHKNSVIYINRDYTITVNGVKVKYTVESDFISCNNGVNIRVIENDTFILELDGGAKFIAANPYVEPAAETPEEKPNENLEEKPDENPEGGDNNPDEGNSPGEDSQNKKTEQE